MPPLWVHHLGDEFWRAAGTGEAFPRTLRPAIRRALPLGVVELAGLSTRGVAARLREQGVDLLGGGVPDRPLRACLVAHLGVGFIFLDAGDPEDERRFSLAHELGHFLRHYLQPRREAGRRLGPGVLEVLDGLRPPTTAERVRGLLGEVTIGCHVHFMGRRADGSASGAVREKEWEADLLAWHLLAPRDAVLARLGGAGEPAEVLRRDFGLPAAQARRYAGVLFPRAGEDPVLSSLGLSCGFLSKSPRGAGKGRGER